MEFEKIIGQKEIIKNINLSIENNKISHAYMFMYG